MVAHTPKTPSPSAERLTAVQRWALDILEKGPAVPETHLQERTFKALEIRGLTRKKASGAYAITSEGLEAKAARRMGRPPKTQGRWAKLIEHYGGPTAFANEIGCSYQAVNRWSLHESVPSAIAARLIRELSEKAGLENPLET